MPAVSVIMALAYTHPPNSTFILPHLFFVQWGGSAQKLEIIKTRLTCLWYVLSKDKIQKRNRYFTCNSDEDFGICAQIWLLTASTHIHQGPNTYSWTGTKKGQITPTFPHFCNEEVLPQSQNLQDNACLFGGGCIFVLVFCNESKLGWGEIETATTLSIHQWS